MDHDPRFLLMVLPLTSSLPLVNSRYHVPLLHPPALLGRRLPPVPTKNPVRVDFVDFSDIGPLALLT